MINIISPERKREIRAARINVVLTQYCVMLALLGMLVGAIYGTGFWLVHGDEMTARDKIDSQGGQAKTFASAEKQAETFKANLSTAKSILGAQTSYSEFLTSLAGSLPSGTILAGLQLGGTAAATASTTTPLKIDARTKSYDKVLELKTALENSPLFENVSIVSTARPESLGELTGASALYPYEASYSVKLSAPAKTTTGATP